MIVTSKVEGIEETVENLNELSRATQRNAVRRALLTAGEITADAAARLAPRNLGKLSFSISVATQLTRRHKAEQRNRASEVEVYIGPATGLGSIYYASHVEFGTRVTPRQPFLRPGWEATKAQVLNSITVNLRAEVEKSAARAARKVARLAAG